MRAAFGELGPGDIVYRVVDGVGVAEAEHPSRETPDATAPIHTWSEQTSPASGTFAGASDGRFMQHGPDIGAPTGFEPPILHYTFRVPDGAEDDYVLYLRGSGASLSADSAALHLLDADGTILATHALAQVPGNGTWGWHTGPTVHLLPGDYTVEAAKREDGVALDKIVLQSSGLAAPSAMGPGETPRVFHIESPTFVVRDGRGTAEAEHFTSMEDDTVAPIHEWLEQVSPSSGAFSSAANSAYMIAAPNLNLGGTHTGQAPYLFYQFRIPEAAGTDDYRVYIRGTGANGQDNSAHVAITTLDGTVVATAIATVNDAGTWSWAAGPLATLASGDYRVRVAFREDGIAVDRVVIQRDALAAPSGLGPDESVDVSTSECDLGTCTESCGPQRGEPGGCSPDCPCDEGGGACDDDGDCMSSLVCGTDNGAPFLLSPTADLCWGAHCDNGVLDGDETGIDCGGACGWCPPPPHANVELAPGGTPLPIYVDTAVSPVVEHAVNHLAATLTEMTGTTFSVQDVAGLPVNGSYVAIGTSGAFGGSTWPFGGGFSDRALRRMDHVVWTTTSGTDQRLLVGGASDSAVLRGIARLLRTLGYYHLIPSPEWEIIPTNPSPALDAAHLARPQFLSASFWAAGGNWADEDNWGDTPDPAVCPESQQYCELFEWQRHNGLETEPDGLASGHAYARVIDDWRQHYTYTCGAVTTVPEFPAALLTAGQFCITAPGAPLTLASGSVRVRDHSSPDPCASIVRTFTLRDIVREDADRYFAAHPEEFSLSLAPNDGPPALWDSASCGDSVHYAEPSDRMVQIANWAADDHPDRLITVNAYSATAAPPTIDVAENVAVWVATQFAIGEDRTTAESGREWRRRGARVVGIRDYFSTHMHIGGRDRPGRGRSASPGEFADSIAGYRDDGVRVVIAEASGSFAPHGLSYWMLSRLTDSEPMSAHDVDALRDEYVEAAFGEDPDVNVVLAMRSFFRALHERPLQSSALLHQLYDNLDAAQHVATDPDVQARIRDLIFYVRYLELDREFDRASVDCGIVSAPAALEAQKTAFEAIRRFTYSIRDRWMVHDFVGYRYTTYTYGLAATDLMTTSELYSQPPPANPWKSDPAPTISDAAGFVSAGLAANPPVPFESVEFSRNLLPVVVPHPAGLPRIGWGAISGVYHRDEGRYYTWVDSSPGSVAIDLHVAFNMAAGASYFHDVRLWSAADPRSPQAFSRISPAGVHAVDLATNYSGLHWLDFKDSSTFWGFDHAPGTPMVTILDVPSHALHHRWPMYFYVPRGTTYVGGWAEEDRSFEARYRDAAGAWQQATFRLADYAPPGCHGDGNWLREQFSIPVPGDTTRGQIWRITGDHGSGGNVVLLTVPPEVARAPDEFLLPQEVINADPEL